MMGVLEYMAQNQLLGSLFLGEKLMGIAFPKSIVLDSRASGCHLGTQTLRTPKYFCESLPELSISSI